MLEYNFKEALEQELHDHYEDFCSLSKELPLIYKNEQNRMDWFSEVAMKKFSSLYNEICSKVLEDYHQNLMRYLSEELNSK